MPARHTSKIGGGVDRGRRRQGVHGDPTKGPRKMSLDKFFASQQQRIQSKLLLSSQRLHAEYQRCGLVLAVEEVRGSVVGHQGKRRPRLSYYDQRRDLCSQ